MSETKTTVYEPLFPPESPALAEARERVERALRFYAELEPDQALLKSEIKIHLIQLVSDIRLFTDAMGWTYQTEIDHVAFNLAIDKVLP